jgi:archaellum biogenesis ATPase FlaH
VRDRDNIERRGGGGVLLPYLNLTEGDEGVIDGSRVLLFTLNKKTRKQEHFGCIL